MMVEPKAEWLLSLELQILLPQNMQIAKLLLYENVRLHRIDYYIVYVNYICFILKFCRS